MGREVLDVTMVRVRGAEAPLLCPCVPQCCSFFMHFHVPMPSQPPHPHRPFPRPLPTPPSAPCTRWRARPHAAAVASIMVGLPCLDWDYATLRAKLRPLAVEWDVRQGPGAVQGAGVVVGGNGRGCGMCTRA